MSKKKRALKALVWLGVIVAACMYFSRTIQTITTPKVKLVQATTGRIEQKISVDAKPYFPVETEITLNKAKDYPITVDKVYVKPGLLVKEGDTIFTATINDYQTKEEDLLTKYNQQPFHLRHAVTVEHVMGWFARELGYGDEAEHWSVVGLLHDLDFEQWPEEHCVKCRELMRQAGVDEDTIRSVACHGWGICSELKPEHEMEKVLFACDELTGLIGAAALMRPSRSTKDMELKSLKKKFKDKKFAAGCSREIITDGAQLLGWELDKLLELTLRAMQDEEDAIEEAVAALG